jgi:hypothetical protein
MNIPLISNNPQYLNCVYSTKCYTVSYNLLNDSGTNPKPRSIYVLSSLTNSLYKNFKLKDTEETLESYLQNNHPELFI